MKKLTGFLSKILIVTFLFCIVGNANATVIDFDNLPGGGTLASNTILTTQYSTLGVVFSATENSSPVRSAVISTFQPISGNYWANTDSGSFGPRHDILSIDFSSEVENVSWLTQSYGSRAITFNAYDSNSSLLESVTTTGDWLLTSFSASGIARIDALQPTEGWGWGMDNLSFDSATQVPEPGTAFLIVAGLLGLAGARRKMKS